MKPLTPLMSAFGVLLVLVVWREFTRDASRSLVQEAGLKPLHAREFTADDVAKLEVTAPGETKPAYTIERTDKTWRVVTPFKAPASNVNVGKLVDALAKAEGELRTDDSSALEQFDLSRSRAVDVRAIDKEGKDLAHLAIGRTSGSKGAFVRNLVDSSDESKAYTLTADIRGLLGLSRSSGGAGEPDKPEAGHFHEKEFPQFKLSNVKSVELLSPGRKVSFEKVKKDAKDTEGEWKLTAGGPAPDAAPKKEGVEKAVSTLAGGLHPTALVDPAKKKELGFDAPKYRVAVTTEDGVTRAAVGSTDAASEHYFVRLDANEEFEMLYEASEYEFHQMFPRGTSLFDLKLPEMKDEDLGTIECVTVKNSTPQTLRMSRTGTKPSDDWTLEAPSRPFAGKQSSLRGVMSALKTIRPLDYADAGTDMGAQDVVVKWAAPGAAMDATRTLTIGGKSPAGKDRLFTIGASPIVWVVADATVERVAPEILTVIEPKLLHGWTAEDVKAIRFDNLAADSVSGWALVKDGADWSIVQGEEKKPADAKAAGEFIAKLLAIEVRTTHDAPSKATPLTHVRIENAKGDPVELAVLPLEMDKLFVRAGGLEFEVAQKHFVPAAASFEKKAEAPKEAPPK